MRVVIDTNVVVSAVLLPCSVPRQAFDRAMAHGTVLISSATVAELNDVLRRPHFDRYVHEDERLGDKPPYSICIIRNAPSFGRGYTTTSAFDNTASSVSSHNRRREISGAACTSAANFRNRSLAPLAVLTRSLR